MCLIDLYSQRLFEPLRQLAERFTQIQGGLTAVQRINELLDEEIEIKDSSSNKKRDNTTINSGIVAMQSPTNTVDKCSCAIAKIVKGIKLDNTATPKQYIQYIFE